MIKSRVRFTHFYAGTLKRQVQTAQAVEAAYKDAGLEVPVLYTDERWNEMETEHQVDWFAPMLAKQDKSLEEMIAVARHDKKAFQKLIRATFEFWQDNPELCGDLETWKMVQDRVNGALQEVRKRSGSGSVSAVFTSGGIIATLSAQMLKLPSHQVYSLFEKVINASITRLVYNADSISLASFNDYSYLSAQANNDETNIVTYR
jgi:broad specificity phosphatase PhoE